MGDRPLTLNPFETLIHAHDIVWRDTGFDWRTRFGACDILWRLAIEVAKGKFLGNKIFCNADCAGYECGREAVVQLLPDGDEARCARHLEAI